MKFKGKTILITGASRGIGEAIALRMAKEGANIVIVAKSITEDPRLGGTIYSVAEKVNALGGRALPIKCDIRDEEQILSAVQQAGSVFGGIDTLVNNASAIAVVNTEILDSKKYNLIQDINVKGTFLVTKHCLPYLKKSNNPHIITLSPPIDLSPKWFEMHVAYTISKYSMSMMTLGWSKEFSKFNIAANSLWPVTTIATAAVKNLLGGLEIMNKSRSPEIVADAAYCIMNRRANECSGNLFTDEQVLLNDGVSDFTKYAIEKGVELQKDLFVN